MGRSGGARSTQPPCPASQLPGLCRAPTRSRLNDPVEPIRIPAARSCTVPPLCARKPSSLLEPSSPPNSPPAHPYAQFFVVLPELVAPQGDAVGLWVSWRGGAGKGREGSGVWGGWGCGGLGSATPGGERVGAARAPSASGSGRGAHERMRACMRTPSQDPNTRAPSGARLVDDEPRQPAALHEGREDVPQRAALHQLLGGYVQQLPDGGGGWALGGRRGLFGGGGCW